MAYDGFNFTGSINSQRVVDVSQSQISSESSQAVMRRKAAAAEKLRKDKIRRDKDNRRKEAEKKFYSSDDNQYPEDDGTHLDLVA